MTGFTPAHLATNGPTTGRCSLLLSLWEPTFSLMPAKEPRLACLQASQADYPTPALAVGIDQPALRPNTYGLVVQATDRCSTLEGQASAGPAAQAPRRGPATVRSSAARQRQHHPDRQSRGRSLAYLHPWSGASGQTRRAAGNGVENLPALILRPLTWALEAAHRYPQVLVATEGGTKIVFADRASLGTHGAVQLDQKGQKPASFLPACLQIRDRAESCATFVEFGKSNIQAALIGGPGQVVATEVSIDRVDDSGHPPTRLLLFVAIGRHMTQGTADSLPIKLQHVGGAERGNEFHVEFLSMLLSLSKFAISSRAGRAGATRPTTPTSLKPSFLPVFSLSLPSFLIFSAIERKGGHYGHSSSKNKGAQGLASMTGVVTRNVLTPLSRSPVSDPRSICDPVS
ncbi:hypothetical protein ACVWYI_006183 [Bradyrhizobium sp. LB13.1]